MPTDLDQAFARKRAAQAKVQTEITMLLFWLIMCVGLLFEFMSSGS
jgi:beta-lactamase regulating signal transducer with metallopeptidase domain